MKKEKERTPYSWIWEFAGEHKPVYLASVVFAVLGVACGILPYFYVGDIVNNLLAGYKDWNIYGNALICIALLWI